MSRKAYVETFVQKQSGNAAVDATAWALICLNNTMCYKCKRWMIQPSLHCYTIIFACNFVCAKLKLVCVVNFLFTCISCILDTLFKNKVGSLVIPLRCSKNMFALRRWLWAIQALNSNTRYNQSANPITKPNYTNAPPLTYSVNAKATNPNIANTPPPHSTFPHLTSSHHQTSTEH